MYAPGPHPNAAMTRLQKRVLLGTILVLLIAVVVLAALYAGGANARPRTEQQFFSRMRSCASLAVDQVTRMENMSLSNTSAKLGLVRQYVYCMEQINQMSISLYSKSYVPTEAFTAIYADISQYESLAQAATSSTMDIRTTLLEHLTGLQSLLTK